MATADLVIVANRLPLELVDAPNGPMWRRSPGGLVAALESALPDRNALWLGWSGSTADPDRPDAPPIPTSTEDGSYQLLEVPISREEIARYYDGFANAALWPLYHDAIVTPVYHRTDFDAYRACNQRFANAAAQCATEGATVWVHDYQLQLVPAMLRKLRPDLRIGFFLHIPFPSPDLFMQLPWRREIIRGLLGADLVGFQTSAGTTNFLGCVRRLFCWPVDGSRVRIPLDLDRRGICHVGSFAISVDWNRISATARKPEVIARAQQIRAELGNPTQVLLGVDRLDYTKGIDVRLRAYTELLHEGRLDRSKTVLVQVATPSRENVEEYQRIRDDIELIVGRTNGDLGQIGAPAVHYIRQTQPFDELVALYQAADVMLVTPFRDGMNLVGKEYVACRTGDDGALVLSEFTGAARELAAAWLVNPHDAEAVKNAIVAAATAPPEDVRRRMRAMRSLVMTHDVNRWVRSFMGALESAARTRDPE